MSEWLKGQSGGPGGLKGHGGPGHQLASRGDALPPYCLPGSLRASGEAGGTHELLPCFSLTLTGALGSNLSSTQRHRQVGVCLPLGLSFPMYQKEGWGKVGSTHSVSLTGPLLGKPSFSKLSPHPSAQAALARRPLGLPSVPYSQPEHSLAFEGSD